MDIKKLEQKVIGELFDNDHQDSRLSFDFINGYERALRLVLRWILTK
jgi:hypothetical protein